MMDRWEAQHRFWSSFGVPAYDETSVPDKDEVTFPYITYEASTATWDEETQISASIWTRSTSWLAADTLSDTIETALKDGGQLLHYDGGAIWITAGTPFAQRRGDPDDDRIKRKILTVLLHF